MDPRRIASAIGSIVLVVGATMVFPIVWSVLDGGRDLKALAVSMLVTVAIGAILRLIPARGSLRRKDSFVVVSVGWIVVTALGALPFYLSGTLPSYTDAFFETMSGFTTTGATVLTDIEAVSRGVLFWRSFTHWLGGMGIIVLSLAVFSMIHGGTSLFRAEVPGISPERILPRLKQTAAILWLIYAGFSLAQTLTLMVAGLPLYESLIHTFGTMATGGFSSKNASVEAFNSGIIEAIIIAFMLAAGTNFSLHYRVIQKKDPRLYLYDTEWRGFILIAGTVTLMIIASLIVHMDTPPLTALRMSVFQTVSILTTTGYSSADFDAWPDLARVLLFFLMFVGGCAGSTGGSMKVARVILLVKYARKYITRSARPRSVIQTKLGDTNVDDSTMHDVLAFFFVYVAIYVVGVIAVAATGVSVLTSIAASAATLGNIGPGLEAIGPAMNYAPLNHLAKWVLCGLMLAGRLELLAVLIIFSPRFWRR